MKENEAPEKIWVAVYDKDLSYEWHSDSEFEAKDHNDIEYIRTDAFIEKACEWLLSHNDYQRVLDNGCSIRFDMTQCVMDFRKAMEE